MRLPLDDKQMLDFSNVSAQVPRQQLGTKLEPPLLLMLTVV